MKPQLLAKVVSSKIRINHLMLDPVHKDVGGLHDLSTEKAAVTKMKVK